MPESQALKDARRVTRCLQAVSKVIKKKFTNLTVDETFEIAADILLAIDVVIEEEGT